MLDLFGDMELRAAVKEASIRQGAVLMAIIQTLFDKGIVTPDEFNSTLQRSIAAADQEAAKMTEEARAEFEKKNPGVAKFLASIAGEPVKVKIAE